MSDGVGMHLRYALTSSSSARRLTRRYPCLRHFSITSTTTFLTLIWLYVIWKGERGVFQHHISDCHWDKWEEWPHHAAPHHLVFVADPQLVDPHTYPGRPWPLSSLTESYTDMYMSRNFRLINEKLDPDSIVFLGDLFDGGREWATERARNLKTSQRQVLINLAILDQAKKEGERIGSDGRTDLNIYKPGENGRWSKWKMTQWNSEYHRFNRIFSDNHQLYPHAERALFPVWDVPPDPVSVENGAPNVTVQHYAVGGTKARIVKMNLPGNHDLGIGAKVQVTVRDRFEARFGETNSVYVIGNHTFVSLDTPSLAAYDEFVDGGSVTEERRQQYRDIWKPADEFLDSLEVTGPKAVRNTLNQFYPGTYPSRGHYHTVHDPKDKVDDRPKEKVEKPRLPIILLSHIPFFRNPDVDCGKWRERGKAIPLSAGYQYQNVLTPALSNMIAKKVSRIGDIQHIFSGDDHDYCDISHRFNVGRWSEETQKENIVMRAVREITVKSFSWAMGVRKPGFLLLSLWNPVDDKGRTIGTPLPTIQSQLCLLPDQLSIFINYARLLVLTIAVLFVRAVVIGLRNMPAVDDVDFFEDVLSRRLSSSKYSSKKSQANGHPSGYVSPIKANGEAKGRHRASSTSTSTANTTDNHLSVQRSYNARTRSVSPAGPNTFTHANSYAMPNLQQEDNRPLIDKAGFYPQVRWQDPDESDEESHIGDYDSQGKGKRKPKSRARKALDEFVRTTLFVAVPSALWYGFLVQNG
ncbi:hypothetical protein AC578_8021 [Pseudocercospora eumusae]|uniref:Calcineurin-like phosphoesterase domain-containing protein n=1 Tax=Pseudocercospora eumusae TaxID=321146 RepID=A0A139HGQ6_9PEZI|nr:hypothetical protein AC578_8021 [Pseudocercospora eumusae]